MFLKPVVLFQGVRSSFWQENNYEKKKWKFQGGFFKPIQSFGWWWLLGTYVNTRDSWLDKDVDEAVEILSCMSTSSSQGWYK